MTSPTASAGSDAQRLIRRCVHCGFCTATCPTYVLLGDERDSPRGRIQLIKGMIDGGTAPTPETIRHLDRCLSCLSCMTTCPADVDYAHLIDDARSHIETHFRRPLADRWLRATLAALLTRPRWLGAALALGKIVAPVLRRLPVARFAALGRLAASVRRGGPRLRERTPAQKTVRGRVLLLTGCVQNAAERQIHHATARLLARSGIETIAATDAGCCGALPLHLGKRESARAHARRLIDAWTPWLDDPAGAVDAIVVNASGCGTAIGDYARLLADDPAYASRAGRIAALACDISVYLARIQLPARIVGAALPSVAYHPPCSLQHGQHVLREPGDLLRAAGFEVRPIAESHLCCGSAGVYNILQPAIAGRLRDRKLERIDRTGADLVATGNLGCAIQLAGDRPVVHTVELLDWATGGPAPPAWAAAR